MCQGLILRLVSRSYKQAHCIKLAQNQAASLLLNGTAVINSNSLNFKCPLG